MEIPTYGLGEQEFLKILNKDKSAYYLGWWKLKSYIKIK